MKEMMDFLQADPFFIYVNALGILAFSLAVVIVFHKVVLTLWSNWSKNKESLLYLFMMDVIKKSAVPFLYFGCFLFALSVLKVSPEFTSGLKTATLLIAVFFSVKIVTRSLRLVIERFFIGKDGDSDNAHKYKSLSPIISILIWTIAGIFCLSNLGIDITAIVTGLGIGGVVIALAGQTILKDLFSYFAIILDRPFEIGDFINVGEFAGAIEYIGITSTRVRSINGEQLIFPNSDLIDSRIKNLRRMEERRVALNLAIDMNTPIDKLQDLPDKMQAIIESHSETRFDRAHFRSIAAYSFEIELVYYILSNDYLKYMDTNESVNLSILRMLQSEGVRLAYPSQTVILSQEDGNRLHG